MAHRLLLTNQSSEKDAGAKTLDRAFIAQSDGYVNEDEFMRLFISSGIVLQANADKPIETLTAFSFVDMLSEKMKRNYKSSSA